ncbi:MAG: type II toxin-antitoxin system Phd/YefM family antitoxin [Treponema sp.]|nr:type II toxin-antitoxin system Phd/YefM family antitoxin [Treponema sp.]
MLSVSVGEAKNKLPYFLHLVEEKNEEIQITRHGKPVAFINGKETAEKAGKKQKFLDGINTWREKYAYCLISNQEVDSMFERSKEDEVSIRHPEDFS